MKARIVVLPGDGIGPGGTAEALRVLAAVAAKGGHEFRFEERLMGGCSIDAHGVALTPGVLADCQASSAVLLGAVGGPKWDDPRAKVRPEQGLLGLRKGLSVFANLRPVRVHPALVDASPLKPERLAGVYILVIRELTGGLYFGQPKGRDVRDGHQGAVDTLEYQDFEVRRVVELAFRLARGTADVEYFRKASGASFASEQTDLLRSGVQQAYRWQYIFSGVEHPRYKAALGSLITEPQAQRINEALAPLRG